MYEQTDITVDQDIPRNINHELFKANQQESDPKITDHGMVKGGYKTINYDIIEDL